MGEGGERGEAGISGPPGPPGDAGEKGFPVSNRRLVLMCYEFKDHLMCALV